MVGLMILQGITSCRYKVAEHVFEVSQSIGENFFADFMDNYEPFFVEDSMHRDNLPVDYLFAISVAYCDAFPEYTEELTQDDEGQQILCGTLQEKSVFEFRLFHKIAGVLVCSQKYDTARLLLSRNVTPALLKFALNNALMVLYAIASAPYNTALFHAAVVNYGGKGYMFLGKSGTGKSTHARLWLKYNEGAELLNDDNPVVRYFGETADESRTATTCGVRVYGSPWSGKTPCYKNEDYPLGAFVMLSQAPYNKIERLCGVRAYAALVPCISGKRWDTVIADGLHKTENALAMNIPVWHLECLPDEEAAHVCRNNVVDSLRPVQNDGV